VSFVCDVQFIYFFFVLTVALPLFSQAKAERRREDANNEVRRSLLNGVEMLKFCRKSAPHRKSKQSAVSLRWVDSLLALRPRSHCLPIILRLRTDSHIACLRASLSLSLSLFLLLLALTFLNFSI